MSARCQERQEQQVVEESVWQFALIWQRQNSAEDAQLNPSSSCSLAMLPPALRCARYACCARYVRSLATCSSTLRREAPPSVSRISALRWKSHTCMRGWPVATGSLLAQGPRWGG